MKSIDVITALAILEQDDKPYNFCIKCPFLNGTDCDGPNFFTMTQERRVEWLQLRRAFLRSLEPWKWSYAYIAEAAGLSEGAVVRCFNDVEYDPRVSTLSAIYLVMCPTTGEHPCPLKAEKLSKTVYEDKPETLNEINTLRDSLDRTTQILENIHDSYAIEIINIRDAEKRKVDFLTKEVAAKNEQINSLNAQIARLHEQNDKLIAQNDKLIDKVVI